MNNSDLLIQSLSLCLSFFGYAFIFSTKFKIKADFIPFILFTSIIFFMFIGGLLDLLPEMAQLIHLGGVFSLLYFIFKKDFLKDFITTGFFVFIALTIYFACTLKNDHLVTYDNFSHWALIVKVLYLTDKLPDSSTQIMNHIGYPPGTALFIYFIVRVIGFTESNMLIAQGILLASCLSCFFPFLQKKHVMYFMLSLLFMIYILTIANHKEQQLLVDSLLPIVALAHLYIIFYYKNKTTTMSLLSISPLTTILLIKNSGLYFALINSTLLIYLSVKNTGKPENIEHGFKNIYYTILAIALSVFMLILWQVNLHKIYENEQIKKRHSQHRVSLEHYEKKFLEKSNEDIIVIREKYIAKILQPFSSNNTFLYIGNGTLLCLYLLLRFRFNIHTSFLKTVICINFIYIFYLLSLLLMYIFSMDREQAIVIDSFSRYITTIIIYITGIVFLSLLFNLHHLKTLPVFWRLGVQLLILSLVFWGIVSSNNFKELYKSKKYDISLPEKFDLITKDVYLSPDKSYLFITNKSWTHNWYAYFYCKYKTMSPRIHMASSFKSQNDFDQSIQKSDYLIVVDEEDDVRSYLRNYFSEDKLSYEGVYSLHSQSSTE